MPRSADLSFFDDLHLQIIESICPKAFIEYSARWTILLWRLVIIRTQSDSVQICSRKMFDLQCKGTLDLWPLCSCLFSGSMYGYISSCTGQYSATMCNPSHSVQICSCQRGCRCAMQRNLGSVIFDLGVVCNWFFVTLDWQVMMMSRCGI